LCRSCGGQKIFVERKGKTENIYHRGHEEHRGKNSRGQKQAEGTKNAEEKNSSVRSKQAESKAKEKGAMARG
jgi:hypothetical protein